MIEDSKEISGIILAAGRSSRFGSQKALNLYHGKTLIQHWVEQFTLAKVNHIIIVTNSDLKSSIELLFKNQSHVKLVIQESPEAPLFSSLQKGIAASSNTFGCLITPVDVKPVEQSTLLGVLITAFATCRSNPDDLLALRPLDLKSQKHGHPVFLSKRLCEQILVLPAETSRLDEILRKIKCGDVLVDDPNILTNLNTPEK